MFKYLHLDQVDIEYSTLSYSISQLAHLAVNEVVGAKGKNTGWNSRGNARVFFLVFIKM